jgi:hypothetical protein
MTNHASLGISPNQSINHNQQIECLSIQNRNNKKKTVTHMKRYRTTQLNSTAIQFFRL